MTDFEKMVTKLREGIAKVNILMYGIVEVASRLLLDPQLSLMIGLILSMIATEI